jgi:type IV pilus assembly protein PilV
MNRPMRPCRHAGFSMLEVLIALVVTSIGLLGLAALQATSLKLNHGSFLRTQATQHAHDLADRMRANRVAALGGAYDLDFDAASPAGAAVAPTDLRQWRAALGRELPSGNGAVDVDATGLAVIRVRWNDARGEAGGENVDRDGGADADADGVPDGDGLLEFRLVTEI